MWKTPRPTKQIQKSSPTDRCTGKHMPCQGPSKTRCDLQETGLSSLGRMSLLTRKAILTLLPIPFHVHATSGCTFLPVKEFSRSIINHTVQIFLFVKEWHGKNVDFFLAVSGMYLLSVQAHKQFKYL